MEGSNEHLLKMRTKNSVTYLNYSKNAELHLSAEHFS